ncbi:MAG: hypothetical protein NUW11_10670 [Candidatus Saccharicenans sp.]|nr:hypothetical protein [Candidatus Saccharicenans sp.]
MRITVSNEGLTEAIKTLSLPEGIPFAISQDKFKIVERLGAFERVRERLRIRWEEAGVDGSISGYRPSSGAAIDRLKRMDGSKVGSGGDLRMMSVGTVGIYYIYAFDGRLLAEYDGYGDCLREYIYIGAKMVAEYQPDRVDPQKGKYYYYTTDQVNSTRVVTDDEGNVVYSAAFDPYGGVQQTWVNTFNPEWKFSGHEQDPESSLYYFGARYYDPGLYRFLCPDPVFGESLMRNDTRHWNLYIYCLGSPINYIDISGLWVAHAMINIYRVPGNWRHPSEGWQFFGDKVARTRLDSGNIYLTRNDKGKEELLFYFHFSIYIYNDDCLSYWGTNYNRVLKHELSHVEFYMRHLKPVLTWIEKKYFKEVEKLGADKALENAKNRLSRYVDWIGRINAFWIDEMRGLGYQFWKDINDNWIQWVDDPFNKWLLGLDYCF